MEEERQKNYTIMEGYELPSKGEIYSTKVDQHIELRSMTARDEMKRLSPSSTPLKTLADIIEGCMIETPKIHVYDMCVGDYEFLLHRLRIVTYGPEYKMRVACPHCGGMHESTANLDQLHVKEFNRDEYERLRTITLPRSGKVVAFRYTTPRMLDEIEAKAKEMRRKYKDATVDFSILTKLYNAIESIDGNRVNDFEIERFVNTLPALDLQKILNSIDKFDAYIGVDNELFVDCPKCNNEIKTFFRLGSEFFRPTNI